MNSSIARALAALPEGLEPAEAAVRARARDELARLADELAHTPVPQGRVHRGWILGSLQARVAAGYLAAWLRCGFAPSDARGALMQEAHLRAALRCLGTMSHLRGAVMKAGQLLANWPDLVPEEFAETLAALHFEAPPMHWALVEEVLRAELGGEPEQVFLEFDRRPFAAASLGQVHRARLRDGAAVAVKVQYPGIARTIRGDLANLSLALLPLRLTRDWEAMREQLDDIAATHAKETDYEEEASFQEEAREALADLPGIVVPRVHRDVSTKRVLVTDLLEGVHLADYLARSPSQEDRDLRGTQVMESAFRLYYGARFCYADPHPGNYLFLEDGRTGLLDFGCCRRFDDEDWRVLALAEEAYHRGGDAWEKAMRASVGVDDLSPDRAQVLRPLADWLWEPLRHTGPFDFGAGDYFPRGVAALRDVVRRRATRSVPLFTWVHRSLIGVRAMACRLRARVDMRTLHERESAAAFV